MKISVYLPLGQYLESQRVNGEFIVSLTFKKIEELIHRQLPITARKNKNWWANSSTEKSRQCSAWLDYGWKKTEVNFEREYVVFEYMRQGTQI